MASYQSVFEIKNVIVNAYCYQEKLNLFILPFTPVKIHVCYERKYISMTLTYLLRAFAGVTCGQINTCPLPSRNFLQDRHCET